MAKTRHLHASYDRTFCGKDASHILMTFDPTETNCSACKKGLAKHQEEEVAAEAARLKRIEEERQAREAEEQARVDEMAEIRRLKDEMRALLHEGRHVP